MKTHLTLSSCKHHLGFSLSLFLTAKDLGWSNLLENHMPYCSYTLFQLEILTSLRASNEETQTKPWCQAGNTRALVQQCNAN